MTPEQIAQERRSFFQWLVAIGILNMVILAILSFGILEHLNTTTDEIQQVQNKQTILAAKLRTSNIASCTRGSAAFAREIIDAGQNAATPTARQRAAFKILRFKDCELSEDLGRTVYQTPAEITEYINYIAVIMGVKDWDKRKG